VIYQATKDQVDAAVAAAVAAAPLMREMTLDERSIVLRKAQQKLLEQREEMALAVSSESGKPIKEARLEVEPVGGNAAVLLRGGAPIARRGGPDGRRRPGKGTGP